MTDQTTAPTASPLFSGITLLIGIICISAAAIGIFWISKILPGLYASLSEDGYSFMKNAIIFHAVWLVFFLSLLLTGIKLIISAINKRTTDLVPGLPLYFVGASLVVIGLFYLIFQQTTYAIIAIVAGILCIYFEGAVEIT